MDAEQMDVQVGVDQGQVMKDADQRGAQKNEVQGDLGGVVQGLQREVLDHVVRDEVQDVEQMDVVDQGVVLWVFVEKDVVDQVGVGQMNDGLGHAELTDVPQVDVAQKSVVQ